MALYPLLPMFENIVLHAIWLLAYLMQPMDLAKLTSSWDATNPYQLERAFCANVKIVAYDNKSDPKDPSNGLAIALIKEGSVQEAPTDGASDNRVRALCPDDDSTIIIHTHTPTTCETVATGKTECVLGGGDAGQCNPSDIDLITTAHRVLHVGAVQCDRNALVFYSPVVKNDPPRLKKRSPKPLKRLNLGVVARQGPGYAWRLLNRQPSR